MRDSQKPREMSSSIKNLLKNIEMDEQRVIKAFLIADKSGRQRDMECAFTLLDENGNPVGAPIASGSFAGMRTPTMHMPPVELFDLEYGVEYIEGFIIDGKFYSREGADIELGGQGEELHSEQLYEEMR